MSERKPPTTTNRSAGRKAKTDAVLSAAQGPTPRGVILTIAVVLFLAMVIITAVVMRGHSATQPASGSGQILPSSPTGTTTAQMLPKRVANNSGVPGVLAWDTTGWPGNGNSYPGALEQRRPVLSCSAHGGTSCESAHRPTRACSCS
ncbi:MAG: hypothetical protein ABI662_02100 [Dermatophilaceae bacterium]